jgi:amidophosphoribosyltransferase
VRTQWQIAFSAQLIDLARAAGARQVYSASAAPPVMFPNVYGLARPPNSELVASSRTEAEVAELIGADWLIYQDLHDLIAACVHDHSSIKEFDTSCFSGNYVTGDVTPEYLARLESERSDSAKATRREAAGLKVVKS